MERTTANLELSGQAFLRTIEDRVEPIGTIRLGILLRDLRESRHLTLRDVALLPHLRAELEDIEAGRVRPDSAVISALLRCFGADIDELVPPREALSVNEGTDDEVLARYQAKVRRWPGSTKHPQLRGADLEQLARILGTEVGEIHRRLRNHAISERIEHLSAARLGALVHKLRHSGRLTHSADGPLPETESELESIEAGRRRAAPATIDSLLSYYDTDIDAFVPPRETLVVLGGTDKEVLTRYLAAMRRWRGNLKHQQLREADLHVLAGILGTDPTDIQRRLRKLTGCSRRRARRLSATLLVAMAATPASVALFHGSGASAAVSLRQDGVVHDPQQTGDAVAAGTPVATVQAAAQHATAAPGTGQAPAVVHSTTATQPASVTPATVNTTTVNTATVNTTTVNTATAHAASVHPAAVHPAAVHPAAVAAAPTTTAAVPTANDHITAAPAATVHTLAADCATALAYLALHAKPGFAHYCRPTALNVGIPSAVAYTCVPGAKFSCPDGNAEIIIADPGCPAAYENEASNSYWDFSSGGVIKPGSTQDGRTWDPYGECP